MNRTVMKCGTAPPLGPFASIIWNSRFNSAKRLGMSYFPHLARFVGLSGPPCSTQASLSV